METRVRHLSVRVPWHDTDWTGRVCRAPSGNGSCLALSRINESRVDAVEDEQAGQDWSEIGSHLPPCVRERAGFMRPTEFQISISHPYSHRGSPAHEKLTRLTLRLPPYSAPCVPFRWMRREEAEQIAADEGLDYRPELEDEADALIPWERKPGWVQHGVNQRTLLEGFFSPVQPPALVFFYAKRIPLTEQEGRVLIGAAHVKHVTGPQEYGGENPLHTLAWECMVQHSLGPTSGDGFLLPYHEAVAATAMDDTLDPEQFVAFAPTEAWQDFAFASEWVGDDAAITSLVALERALQAAERHLPSSRHQNLQWLSERLGELWTLRGPCPGLGSALHAFGVDHATLVVRRLERHFAENGDPWEVVERAMEDPHAVSPGLQQHLGINLRRKWSALDGERRSLLKLLSRFALTPDQAERWYQPDLRAAAGINCGDADILANPYLMYEADRYSENPIPVRAIDHGAFPANVIQTAHPLPSPSAMEDALDVRRARALMVAQLEQAAIEGNTLLPAGRVIEAVRDFELDPPCRLDRDQLLVYGDGLKPTIHESRMADGGQAFQLDRLRDVSGVIARFVDRRRAAQRDEEQIEWGLRLSDVLGPVAEGDRNELLAREEKIAALQEMYSSRVAVLIGPAGTGKTTILRVLCDVPQVEQGNILLLAPTGKARVRLASALGRDAYTIAQFLLRHDRYVPETGRYRLSSQAPADGYRTVIIDEASMLTEEQLAAVIDGVKGVARFILVGDPRQLPPIGAGRPFVDIVNRLRPDDLDGRFPRCAPCCGELVVPRRQSAVDGPEAREAEDRADLMLAEWFGGRPLSPGADAIWDHLASGKVDGTLTVVRWSDPHDLRERLLDVLVDELPLDSRDDTAGFELACGGSEYQGRMYFWRKRDENGTGAAEKIEAWQILSPVRGHGHGVRELNRFLQRHFRSDTLKRAKETSWNRKIPRPLGLEEIVWGDKVISVDNEPWRNVYPKEGALRYIANGDIGIVVGQYKTKAMKGPPWKAQVEFAGQEGFVYDYETRDFGDEGSPPLELGYALTVHKSQGSEFNRTIVVIPNPCRILTRELLYTALTRQRTRVTLMYQGDPADLKRYASPVESETATRLTNLFAEPTLVEASPGTFLEEGLIHLTTRGDLVRSKSEVLIANLLHGRNIEYAYERRLSFDDGSARYPDFTIEDDDLGRTIYWEHLGMLNDSAYARRWEEKRQWYARHGVVEYPATGREVLVSTRDDEMGGINSQQIAALIDELFV